MKQWISYIMLIILIPAVVLGGTLLVEDKQYAWISLCVTVLSCVPFFLRFEKKETNTKRLILIAAMVALSVVGRMLFTPIPGFKPITAMVVITAMYFGSEAGFMTGALSALISNFYFGQGPWTPFQMFSWGIVGFLAGLLAKPMKQNKIILGIYAVFSGALYSMLMDVWTVLWADGSFHVAKYLAAVLSSAQFMIIYAVSNLVFLCLFAKPIGTILERVKTKYAL